MNHFFPISLIKLWIEYFGLFFEWIFDWKNISNLVLNWILNWIIFGPDSMFDWIIKTYRPGLMSPHCILWYGMVLYFIWSYCTVWHCYVLLLQRAGELPRSASSHFIFVYLYIYVSSFSLSFFFWSGAHCGLDVKYTTDMLSIRASSGVP